MNAKLRAVLPLGGPPCESPQESGPGLCAHNVLVVERTVLRHEQVEGVGSAGKRRGTPTPCRVAGTTSRPPREPRVVANPNPGIPSRVELGRHGNRSLRLLQLSPLSDGSVSVEHTLTSAWRQTASSEQQVQLADGLVGRRRLSQRQPSLRTDVNSVPAHICRVSKPTVYCPSQL